MEGRWDVHVCKDCGQRAHYQDKCPKDRRRIWTEMVVVPVVPCDDAAVERAAKEIYAEVYMESDTSAYPPAAVEWADASSAARKASVVLALNVLRAAGEVA